MARAAATAPGMVNGLFDRESTKVRTDEQLLQQFISRSDESAEAAFALLVARYGPIVHRVCLSTLGNSHDTQDAAQAVFLVLARKARSIRKPESLGPWLHGVSVRVAGRVRSQAARRKSAERQKADITTRQQDLAEHGHDSMDHHD